MEKDYICQTCIPKMCVKRIYDYMCILYSRYACTYAVRASCWKPSHLCCFHLKQCKTFTATKWTLVGWDGPRRSWRPCWKPSTAWRAAPRTSGNSVAMWKAVFCFNVTSCNLSHVANPMVSQHQGSSAGVVASSSLCREEAKGGAIFLPFFSMLWIRASFGRNKKHGTWAYWLVCSYFVGPVCTVHEFRQMVFGGLGWWLNQPETPQLSGVKKNPII